MFNHLFFYNGKKKRPTPAFRKGRALRLPGFKCDLSAKNQAMPFHEWKYNNKVYKGKARSFGQHFSN
jgi:hypothetical protein